MIEYPNYYDKIVIVCFPTGAGGKFLINNLGLNDQAVFQSAKLAQAQLDGNFSYQNKIDYLRNQLQQAAKIQKWDDLALGCSQLFGVNTMHYLTEYHEILSTRFDLVVKKTISKKLCLFVVAHNTLFLRSMLNFWPNARVIGFSNSKDFINQNRPKRPDVFLTNRLDHWNLVKDKSWPKQPPATKAEFLELPDAIQHELVDLFDNEIARWFNDRDLRFKLFEKDLVQIQNKLKNKFYQIDIDKMYQTDQSFLINLKNCLQWLDLPMPVNENDNCEYFQTWKEVISLVAYR
jgi:hypothetical protein